MPEKLQRVIGTSVPRKDDAALITGRANGTDNNTLPRILEPAALPSPFAHAKITSNDASEAANCPGVVAVFTGTVLVDK